MKTFFSLLIIQFIALTACKKEKTEQPSNSGNIPVDNNIVKKAPIAKAGPDQRATSHPFLLDGSASLDSDGVITGWQWRKIYGPGDVVFSEATQKQTNVTVNLMGIFQFELEVTDNDGLTGTDTVNIFFFLPGYLCDTVLRPVIQSSLKDFWRFPFDRFGVGVTTLGTKVYFAGGRDGSNGNPISHVAILDMETQQESQAYLSIPRAFIGCVSAGNKIFFAGGWTWSGALSRVEIIDIAAGTSTTAELSEPRWDVATAVLGNKVFFAGGYYWVGSERHVSSKIDIYDLSTNQWSVSNLTEARGDIATVVVNDKIYFAGGSRVYSVSSAIDIYDGQTNSWSVSNLNEAVAHAAAISAGGKIYFAGGYDISISSGGAPIQNATCEVQIKSLDASSFSFARLVSKSSSLIAFVKNNKIIFYPLGENASIFFDVYDIATGTWSVGMIDHFLRGEICFLYKNDLYIAGGLFGSPTFGPIVVNAKILKMEF